MAAAKMRVMTDSELSTEDQIRFRIDLLKKEIPLPQVLNRIKRLQERLPKSPTAKILPAYNAGLLASKKDVGWGDRGGSVQNYASPSCSYQG